MKACGIHRQSIQELEELFGGTFREREKTSAGSRVWEWSLSSFAEVAACLEQISKLLIVKRQQAELGLEFLSTRQGQRGVSFSKQELRRFDELKAAFGELNGGNHG